MKKLLFALVLLAAQTALGQEGHYLEPVRDFSKYDQGVLREYYDNVFTLLHKGFSDKPVARYTVIPSFSEEYAFSLERDGGKYYIVSHNFAGSYWYSKNRKAVKLNVSRREISRELYDRTAALFQLLAHQIRKPDQEEMGFDGATCYFACTNAQGEVIVGETWSPWSETPLGKLVDICDDIYLLGGDANVELLSGDYGRTYGCIRQPSATPDEILKHIDELIARLSFKLVRPVKF